MTFKIEFSYLTNPGKVRPNNEDNALVDAELELAIVADGMGGHKSGEMASAMAVKITKEKYESMHYTGLKPNPYIDNLSLEANQLLFAAQLANSVIYETGNASAENKGMGTTLTAALLNKNRLSVIHIGDSRLYVLRDDALQQLTEDHSLVMDHVKKGIMTMEQAEKSPLQNILTRALGTQKKPQIDAFEFEIKERDRIILCTDGLFKTTSDEKMKEILGQNSDNLKACETMVETANINGGPDNVTVAIGRVLKKHWKEKIKTMFRKSYA
ncbi:MAG: Stp1/IreP family PP2C-type Ser/Thr phosphatase [Elusimicrobia bacterium]|nr:Stp1/IreP family PP2C-type Ser/Thr phosphatase [Elusimicrobiota bacterium]